MYFLKVRESEINFKNVVYLEKENQREELRRHPLSVEVVMSRAPRKVH